MLKQAILVVSFSVSSIAIAHACSVDLGRGWSRGAGNGTLVMAAASKPCGGTLWILPDARLAAKTVAIIGGPANGKVTANGGSFAYTPNKGFSPLRPGP